VKARDALFISGIAVLVLLLSVLIFLILLRYLPLLAALILALIALSIIVGLIVSTLAGLVRLAAGLYFALRPGRREEQVRPVRLEEAREPDRGEGEE